MTADSARTILVVDDDDALRTRLVRAFRERGLEARGAASAEEAIALATVDSPELAVVDLRMPGSSGLQLVRELVTIDRATRVVVLTGYGSIATALEAIRLGAVHYLTKPADAEQILAAFERPSAAEPGAAALDGSPATETVAAFEVASLARAEWEHIQRVLTDCSGNVSQAARLLGIHRRSLQRKLSKYPLAR
jgi:two-component system response regulator RegA